MRTTANDLIESLVAQISDLRQEVTSIRSAKNEQEIYEQIVMVEKKSKACLFWAPIVSDGKSFPLEYWDSITKRLNELLDTLKELLYVPSVIIQKIFPKFSPSLTYNFSTATSVCYYIKECCTFANGEHVKAGLARLDNLCSKATTEYADSSLDELNHVRQAIDFLVIQPKSKISYDELTTKLCPVLSIHKLCKLCTFYSHDSDDTDSVSPDVISKFKVLMSEDSNDPDSDSYLLDDNSGSTSFGLTALQWKAYNFLKQMYTRDPQETGLHLSFSVHT
ncbi:myosin-7-like protein isoform X1 [Tanacetum coccineum]